MYELCKQPAASLPVQPLQYSDSSVTLQCLGVKAARKTEPEQEPGAVLGPLCKAGLHLPGAGADGGKPLAITPRMLPCLFIPIGPNHTPCTITCCHSPNF